METKDQHIDQPLASPQEREVLTALKDILARFENERDIQLGNGYPEDYAAIDAAKSAIAKAESAPLHEPDCQLNCDVPDCLLEHRCTCRSAPSVGQQESETIQRAKELLKDLPEGQWSIIEEELVACSPIDIGIDGAPLLTVLNVDDFPCIDDDKIEQVDREAVAIAKFIVAAPQLIRDLLASSVAAAPAWRAMEQVLRAILADASAYQWHGPIIKALGRDCRCDCVNCVTGNHADCYYEPSVCPVKADAV